MHFRERSNVIQVIRSRYDAGTKRGKTEVAGRIRKANPAITDDLRKALSADEVKEVEAWLSGHQKVHLLKAEVAAKTLGEQMALASEWFQAQKGDEAKMLAANIALQWSLLRSQLRKQGLAE